MQVYNETTDTLPYFVHAQGYEHSTPKWIQLVNDIVPNQKVDDIFFPDNKYITIITFVSGFMVTSLDRQLQKAGIGYIDLAKYYKHSGRWTNANKIIYTNMFMEQIKTPYVLSLDAIDVLAASNLIGLIDTFLRMNCDILYGASCNCHPPENEYVEDATSRWKYLNAGTMLAKTEALSFFYGQLSEEALKAPIDEVNNEQALIKELRPDFDNIKADTDCQIFQTLAHTKWSYDKSIKRLAVI
jgi:hypothetical protein